MACILCHIIDENKSRFFDVFKALNETGKYWYIEDPFETCGVSHGGYSHQDSIRFKRIEWYDTNIEELRNNLDNVLRTVMLLEKECDFKMEYKSRGLSVLTSMLKKYTKAIKTAKESKQEGLEITIVNQECSDDVDNNKFRDMYETAGPFTISIDNERGVIESKHKYHLNGKNVDHQLIKFMDYFVTRGPRQVYKKDIKNKEM